MHEVQKTVSDKASIYRLCLSLRKFWATCTALEKKEVIKLVNNLLVSPVIEGRYLLLFIITIIASQSLFKLNNVHARFKLLLHCSLILILYLQNFLGNFVYTCVGH